MSSPVIVFGPTGKIGSAAALTASQLGATVWLAMRDTSKSIPGLSHEAEASSGKFHRVQADLNKPDSIRNAVQTSGAKRAFIYLAHSTEDHMHGTVAAMKDAGIEFVVFLSSFTVLVDRPFREVPPNELLAYIHGNVEATLDEIFGEEGYVAVRPGCFATNLLSEHASVAKGAIDLYGGDFEQDNIVPGDIGRVVGNILVNGAKNGQKKVYLYGPNVMPIRGCMVKIGEILGKDLEIKTLTLEEGYERYISRGMPPTFARFMADTLSGKGPDKGNGERFPRYEEGVKNVELYTGKPATNFEEWVKASRGAFS